MHDIFVPWVQNQVVDLSIYCAQNQVGCLIMDRFAESPRDCGSGKGLCVDPDTCIPQSTQTMGDSHAGHLRVPLEQH